LLADEQAATVVAFVERALAWFAGCGITCRRVMTDGAWTYTHNNALRELFDQRGITHIVTPPYTPRWNGKVERFHQTMEREWAKGLRYRNSSARNRALRELLAERGIHHIVTPPYTPRWNGKVERFHQTMEREWAKGLRYRNSTARNRALPHWLRHYNERRPHSSLGGRPPISRAHNL
jgi:transposase InsO family protein